MIRNLLDKINIKAAIRKKAVRAGIYIMIVSVLAILTYITYEEYKNTIVAQQQQQMLGVSKSISRSLELFINDIEDSMKIITLDKQIVKDISYIEQGKMLNNYNEKLKSYYEAEGKPVNAVYFYNSSGKVLTQYPQGIEAFNSELQKEINVVVETKKTYIGRVYLDENKNNFIFNIYEPVFNENSISGIMVVSIRLDAIYDRLIAPVKIGEKGYAMVKDQDGTIIMHPVKEQIGMDVIETRKQIFPGLDFSELEDLINKQLTGQEGTAIYHSYWWGDNVLKKAKKLNAYTPVHLGDYFWVVALTMSYDEIQGPINMFLAKVVGIAVLLTVIIYFFIFTLLKMKKNKEELERETKYLKMLNESSEQLRKKEAELYHSHKLKMIGTLAGGIAHDINNLLSPILGYSELLLMTMPKNNEYYDDVEEIYKASQKGKDLVEQILVFSRNDNGIVKVESININEVVRQTLKLVKAVLPKKVVIRENIEENCGYTRANFTQIHQVIFNLCTNAYQAIKDKEGIIEVTLKSVKGVEIQAVSKSHIKEKDYVELTIKDTGCGMDVETKERIFDPFFTTKTIGEGTGLGLFVVQSIIDKYKGIITVESEPNYGSCFRVYLPIVKEEVNLRADKSDKNIEKYKKRILVVDDNVDVIKLLKKGLHHLGYKVITETDSFKALKIFEKDYRNIDLVITDYIMPNIKGGELSACIKEIKRDTGVILMTGYMDENKKDINEMEFIDGCISKPIELTQLSELIKNVMSKFS